MIVRKFKPQDVPQVLVLMTELAEFEGYAHEFKVTADDLLRHGFGPNPAFGVFVADTGHQLSGIAVYYVIPWTFDMQPTLVLKELYVGKAARGFGVGALLIKSLVAHAVSIRASRIRWTVMDGNHQAERFYEKLGGKRDAKWQNWEMLLPLTSDQPRLEAL
jgi:GNAT superfamily N-acetyltransferase